VIPGIYQVRGLDLSDITFIKGKTGWIVYDVLVSAETARAAWKLFQEHVGKGLPISAVIYSHTHVDHWGGVRGLLKDEDVKSGKVLSLPGWMAITGSGSATWISFQSTGTRCGQRRGKAKHESVGIRGNGWDGP